MPTPQFRASDPDPDPGPGRPAAGLSRAARACVVGHVGAVAKAERLTAMGLGVGAVFEVVKGGGTLAVRVGESTLALGQDWAAALRVVEL